MKSVWASKTLWFNVVTALVAIASLTDVLPKNILPVAGIIAAIGNIILRVFFTTQAVGINK